ncbi:MAG: hypothetical protein ACMUJM_04820 [bacterium]
MKRFYMYLLINTILLLVMMTLSHAAVDPFWYAPDVSSSYTNITFAPMAGQSETLSTYFPFPNISFYTDIYTSYYDNLIKGAYVYPYLNVSFYEPPPYDEPLWQAIKQSGFFPIEWNSSLPAPSDFKAYYLRYDYIYKGPIEIHLTWKDNSYTEEGFIINYFCGYNWTNPCGHIELPPNTTELTLPVQQATRRPRWIPRPTINSFSLLAYDAEGETSPVKATANLKVY